VRKLILYARMMGKLLKKETVTAWEVAEAYDQIADSYQDWSNCMGSYLEQIFPDSIQGPDHPTFLDLACGSGDVSARLLDRYPKSTVVAVDLSSGMLEKAKSRLGESRVRFVHQDAASFLRETREPFDGVWIGWAYPYIKNALLLRSLNPVIKPGGVLGIISNRKGTLKGIIQSYQKVMERFPHQVVKPMDTHWNLPRLTLNSDRMKQAGFRVIKEGIGAHPVCFPTPEQLVDWVQRTGAVAGTRKIFRHFNPQIQQALRDEVARRCSCAEGYGTSHWFVYGLFAKEGTQ